MQSTDPVKRLIGFVCLVTPDAPPSIIGNRYQLHDMIGAGGMGTVYRGNDAHAGQMFTTKLLKPEAVTAPALLNNPISAFWIAIEIQTNSGSDSLYMQH